MVNVNLNITPDIIETIEVDGKTYQGIKCLNNKNVGYLLSDGKFILDIGCEVRKAKGSIPLGTISQRQKYSEFIDLNKTTKKLLFSSISQATAFIYGSSKNGWDWWTNLKGDDVNIYRRTEKLGNVNKITPKLDFVPINLNLFNKFIKPGIPHVDFTSLEEAEKIINKIPKQYWNKDSTFVDLDIKEAAYLIAVYNKLMSTESMVKEFSPKERSKHILDSQLAGVATNDMLLDISLRNLYGELRKDSNIKKDKEINLLKFKNIVIINEYIS